MLHRHSIYTGNVPLLYYYFLLSFLILIPSFFFFFFNDTATTEIYTLPYTTLFRSHSSIHLWRPSLSKRQQSWQADASDRKSTRLNSSHEWISYAVFCLKKKNKCDSACRIQKER